MSAARSIAGASQAVTGAARTRRVARRVRSQALMAAAGAGVAAVGAGTLELRDRWTRSGAAGLRPDTDLVRGVLARMTTPLLPDDYLNMVNPLWTARELRGRLVKVVPETEQASTLVIRPGWGWSFDYQPGQFAGIGIEVDGRWMWRSYSITSAPSPGQRHIAITVKAMPEGRLSSHLVHDLPTGTIVRLALPQGNFVLPDPPPAKVLFWTGGSGITPVMGMLRTMARRGTMSDVVHVHVAPSEADFIFAEELRGLAEDHPSLRLITNFDDTDGRLDLQRLGALVPDWQDRQVWVCGPAPLLDAAEEHWERARLADRLHLERFSANLSTTAEGGTVTFARSGRSVRVDGATTLLEAGESAGVVMPFGCRMGICHSCVAPLSAGTVKDLRDGTEYPDHQGIQTCVTAAAGDCTIDL